MQTKASNVLATPL